MDKELASLYRTNETPVVFIDESLERTGPDRFYILSAVVIDAYALVRTRASTRAFYSAGALHAAPMNSGGQRDTLALAMVHAAENNDGTDLVLVSPMAPEDKKGEEARHRCVRRMVEKLHSEYGARLFVFDRRDGSTLDSLDISAFSELHREGRIDAHVKGIHCYPSDEILLGLPDVLAWAYRQKITGRSDSWYAPFAKHTQVTSIETPDAIELHRVA